MYRAILNLYKRGRITKDGVADAVKKGIITAEEYASITGEKYSVE